VRGVRENYWGGVGRGREGSGGAAKRIGVADACDIDSMGVE
jgi:hypothetical protein